ncbi:hypothetical protein ACFXJ8_41455 [Nonomuraea sp. NPDC059194]|uniref:hypothetical protein n=1 Tax=Nonomuraea sp. NPDC059194 TaxID=3346764 RepID=UPI00367D7044
MMFDTMMPVAFVAVLVLFVIGGVLAMIGGGSSSRSGTRHRGSLFSGDASSSDDRYDSDSSGSDSSGSGSSDGGGGSSGD